jgi:hypothetical protein
LFPSLVFFFWASLWILFFLPQTLTSSLLWNLPPTPPTYSPPLPPQLLLHSLHCQQVEHLGLGAWSIRNEISINYFKASTSQFFFVPLASSFFLLPPHYTKTTKLLFFFQIPSASPKTSSKAHCLFFCSQCLLPQHYTWTTSFPHCLYIFCSQSLPKDDSSSFFCVPSAS